MAKYKAEKMTELIRELAAEFLEIESNRTSLITVTRVLLSENQKSATILLTVLPEDKENTVIEFARRQVDDFRDFVKKKALLRMIPFFSFEIDMGEKNRQKIDEISLKA